ncbi:F-box/kelch-repeat protein [Acetobacter orientalis]|uniref:F-box/kelch-repeat protein n=1 Tax=Acetobacter orientalis TaxID=146474 RepID=A0A2Z5ZKF2_9PROT|nr:F-box/kelch-repeat protein [Acetobacter orientalis]
MTDQKTIGIPVKVEDFNRSRECFEAFYAEMCAKATGCSGVTTDYVRGLRCGDNYGGRVFLNNIWEAWPDFVDQVMPLLASRDAEIARLNEELSVYRAGMSELITKEVAALKGGAA